MLKTRTKRVLAAALANPRASREPASEHVRNAIQVLENLLEFGTLDDEDRKDVRAAIGRLWLGLSLYCLEKTGSRGEQGSPGRTSRDFERKSAMDERPREFSKSAKFLVTIRTCLRGPIIRIVR